MKPIATMWLTGDLENCWYKMKEPDGRIYEWDSSEIALKICEENGWQCVWEDRHDGRFDCYTPAVFNTNNRVINEH